MGKRRRGRGGEGKSDRSLSLVFASIHFANIKQDKRDFTSPIHKKAVRASVYAITSLPYIASSEQHLEENLWSLCIYGLWEECSLLCRLILKM